MSFNHYDSAVLHNMCMATNCRHLAHVLGRKGEEFRPHMCGAKGVLEKIRRGAGQGGAFGALEEALAACAGTCRERLLACEAKDIKRLRELNVLVQENAGRVRAEMRRLV